jgi:hypothetical protein
MPSGFPIIPPKHQTTAALNKEHSGRQIIQAKNLKGTRR